MSDEGNIGRLVRSRMWFDDGFSQVPNTWIRDNKLSFTARGVLVLIVSHEAGYVVTIKAIAAGTVHGIAAIRTAVGELERYGYLRRYRRREKGRIVGTDWRLIDPHGPVDNSGQGSLDIEALPALGTPKTQENPRSEPRCTLPALVEPALVEPALVEPALANRTTKEDQLKEYLTTSTRELVTEGKCSTGRHDLVDDRHCGYGCTPLSGDAA